MCVSRSSRPMAVRKLPSTPTRTPPTIHTHAPRRFLATRRPPSSTPPTCIVSDSLMWNCFSFKFPPGNAGRRKMLHLIMACYCCSFIRVLGFWVQDLSAPSWGHTRLFLPPNTRRTLLPLFVISDSTPSSSSAAPMVTPLKNLSPPHSMITLCISRA